MTQLEKVIYTAKTHTTGGRADGVARSDDGRLDIRLSRPGQPGEGTNPEQLFAAGYSACFIGALKAAAGQRKMRLPPDTKIDAAVGIGPISTGFNIKVDMAIHIPGVERAVAEQLVQEAHLICPYSNATRGNVEVDLKVD